MSLLLLFASLAVAGPRAPEAGVTLPYPLLKPPEAVLPLDLPTLAGLTVEERDLWERHMRTSLAWEIRQERGCRLAIRLEPRHQGDQVVYESTLNGYDSDFKAADGVYQSRVMIGLGCDQGLGVFDRGQITHSRASYDQVQVLLEDDSAGDFPQPGLESRLLLRCGEDDFATVEIYEQGDPVERPFTRHALAALETELAAVLASRDELLREGVVEALVPPGSTRTGAPSIMVEDGMQPGIYLVTAWVNPGGPGVVEARVVYEGPEPGHEPPPEVGTPGTELSAERLRPRSWRQVGWGPSAERLFRYQSEVTVYEGDWGQQYRARFELWHRDLAGKERPLVQHVRTIEGWMR